MCTTVIVGKNVSKTGRVIVGHNEDAGGRTLHQQFYCPAGHHAPGETVTAEPGRAAVPQASETLATYWSNMLEPGKGSSFDQGFANEAGLVICSNGGGTSFDGDLEDESSLALKNGGVGFLVRRLMAERARTPREAVMICKALVEEYGYWSPARNYTVANKDEAWCINIVKGRHFVAKRVPDDKVMLISNMLAIRHVDLNDKENVIASDDLIEYTIQTGRYTPKTPGDYGDFDFAAAYQSDENRHAPTKSHRMRLGWLDIAGVWCADELHYPEILSPKEPMGVQDVMRVLRITNPETYATRGDGRADAFHVSAVDISRSHTRESWVANIAEDPLETVMWRCSSYQDTGVYVPWFPMAGAIPEGYQWMDLETARKEHFAVRPESISLDFEQSYWTYAVLGELVNFNRGLFAGVHAERDALEAYFREELGKLRAELPGMDSETKRAALGRFTCEMCAEADRRYRTILADINRFEAHASRSELSVSDEEATVKLTLKVPADMAMRVPDAKSILWSVGFSTSKPGVNEPAAPLAMHRVETPSGAEWIFTFRAHDAAKFGIAGVTADTYLRGVIDHQRFVAMIPVTFVA